MTTPREESPDAAAPPLPRNGARAVATFFVFVIAGPPLGVLMIVVMGLFASPPRLNGMPQFNPKDIGAFIGGSLFLGMFSYFLASLVACAAFLSIVLKVPAQPSPLKPAMIWLAVAMQVGPGFGCWLIANGFLRLSESRNAQATT